MMMEKEHCNETVQEHFEKPLGQACVQGNSVHCHTCYCDGKNTLQEMVEAACAQGMQTIGFSGHGYTAFDTSYCMMPEGTRSYCAEIARLQQKYKNKIEILCGVEWDACAENIDPVHFDYWIGSVHYLRDAKSGIYYTIDWTKEELAACVEHAFSGDAYAMVEAYFASVAQIAMQKPTVLGHFDLIKKLNADGLFFDETATRYQEAARKALHVARAKECVLEINTGGVYRGYRDDFYPSAWILSQWAKLGGKVTITADAHSVDALQFGYEQAVQVAREAGFAQVHLLTAQGFVSMDI